MNKVDKSRFKQLEKQAWSFDRRTKIGIALVVAMIIAIVVLNL